MKLKLFSIAIVLALLLGALSQVSDLVQDRQTHRQIAVQSVAQSLAGAQTLLGPLLHASCSEEWDTVVGKQTHTERREWQLVAAPSTLQILGNTTLQERARGLHATQVFNLNAKLMAQWATLDALKPVATHANARLRCSKPVLMLAVSDARGIRHAKVQIANDSLPLQPGTGHSAYPRGVHAELGASLRVDAPLQVELALELMGTEQLNFVPVGGDTQVQLTSNWADPSFGGQFLPSERKVSAQGFDATWRVSALASTAQQDVVQNKRVCGVSQDVAATPTQAQGCAEAFGVTFIDPGNTYALSDRATKYGLLFIGLTFLAVGLFEFMKALRVHPIQYLLVGAAMSMFFLLLVSLSEHLSFELAYAVAASSCVLLLSYYAGHMLQGFSRGIPFGAGIALLYGMLFVLLKIEQTALLVGAVALFAVLAAVMALTRRVDWYAQLQAMQRRGASAAD
ncbi:MAG: cell envelope integrity protein CreD [Rhodoferax sp.]|nr:cell envelope integrity protein CreD [Rhodoferax sp.]